MRLSFPNILFTPTPRPTDCNIKWEIKKVVGCCCWPYFSCLLGEYLCRKGERGGDCYCCCGPQLVTDVVVVVIGGDILKEGRKERKK